MTDTTPPVNGQDIGLAARAGRVLLDRVLDHYQTTFDEWVVLRSLSLQQDPVANLGDQAAVDAALETLAAKGLVTVDPVALTDDGSDRYDVLNTAVLAVGRPLYEGFTPEELAITGRVLRAVAQRAMAS
jgi:DNA-binding MarR family transcriptional regulator